MNPVKQKKVQSIKEIISKKEVHPNTKKAWREIKIKDGREIDKFDCNHFYYY